MSKVRYTPRTKLAYRGPGGNEVRVRTMTESELIELWKAVGKHEARVDRFGLRGA